MSWEQLDRYLDWYPDYPAHVRPAWWASYYVYFDGVPAGSIGFATAEYIDPKSASDHDPSLDGWYVLKYEPWDRNWSIDIIDGPFSTESQAAASMTRHVERMR